LFLADLRRFSYHKFPDLQRKSMKLTNAKFSGNILAAMIY
jgi:hypothetical protein